LHHFWTSVIEPLFESLQPRVLVEIGADQGRNTANLCNYCRRHNAVVHVIDPEPKFPIERWQEDWPEAIFHPRLSLESLPRIKEMDAVLIDGDHNWYTVSNELKLIEQTAADPDRFPIVLLHDVDWPHGRRDSYYQPEAIPSVYRHPFARLGVRPGAPDLVRERGLYSQFAHALQEGTPRNGVRTALEDYVLESGIEFHVVNVPGMHGLAILATTSLVERNRKLADSLASFETREFLFQRCQEIEHARIRQLVRGTEKRKLLKTRIKELEKRLGSEPSVRS
jgi:hypothetical protein